MNKFLKNNLFIFENRQNMIRIKNGLFNFENLLDKRIRMKKDQRNQMLFEYQTELNDIARMTDIMSKILDETQKVECEKISNNASQTNEFLNELFNIKPQNMIIRTKQNELSKILHNYETTIKKMKSMKENVSKAYCDIEKRECDDFLNEIYDQLNVHPEIKDRIVLFPKNSNNSTFRLEVCLPKKIVEKKGKFGLTVKFRINRYIPINGPYIIETAFITTKNDDLSDETLVQNEQNEEYDYINPIWSYSIDGLVKEIIRFVNIVAKD